MDGDEQLDKMLEVAKMPVRAPLMAITVMIDPGGLADGSDRIQVQWPPQMQLADVALVLNVAQQTVDAKARFENGGLLIPRGQVLGTKVNGKG